MNLRPFTQEGKEVLKQLLQITTDWEDVATNVEIEKCLGAFYSELNKEEKKDKHWRKKREDLALLYYVRHPQLLGIPDDPNDSMKTLQRFKDIESGLAMTYPNFIRVALITGHLRLTDDEIAHLITTNQE